MFLPIRFRQVDGSSESWRSLLPNAAAAFSWEDLGRERLLEVLVDGTKSTTVQKYNIDTILDHAHIQVNGGSMNAVRVTVLKEEKINVVKISDWMPENETPSVMGEGNNSSLLHLSRSTTRTEQSTQDSESEFHIVVEVSDLGVSIIDHTPEEILYLTMQNLMLSYSTGLGPGISR